MMQRSLPLTIKTLRDLDATLEQDISFDTVEIEAEEWNKDITAVQRLGSFLLALPIKALVIKPNAMSSSQLIELFMQLATHKTLESLNVRRCFFHHEEKDTATITQALGALFSKNIELKRINFSNNNINETILELLMQEGKLLYLDLQGATGVISNKAITLLCHNHSLQVLNLRSTYLEDPAMAVSLLAKSKSLRILHLPEADVSPLLKNSFLLDVCPHSYDRIPRLADNGQNIYSMVFKNNRQFSSFPNEPLLSFTKTLIFLAGFYCVESNNAVSYLNSQEILKAVAFESREDNLLPEVTLTKSFYEQLESLSSSLPNVSTVREAVTSLLRIVLENKLGAEEKDLAFIFLVVKAVNNLKDCLNVLTGLLQERRNAILPRPAISLMEAAKCKRELNTLNQIENNMAMLIYSHIVNYLNAFQKTEFDFASYKEVMISIKAASDRMSKQFLFLRPYSEKMAAFIQELESFSKIEDVDACLQINLSSLLKTDSQLSHSLSA